MRDCRLFAGRQIAFEAARVLQQAGGKVAFVLLLDARARISSSYTIGPALESLARIWKGQTKQVEDHSLRSGLGTKLSKSWALVQWLLSRLPNSVRHRVDRLKSRFGLVTQRFLREFEPSGFFDEDGKPIASLLIDKLSLTVGRLWHPRPLDAAGVLIRADNAENVLPGRDPSEGWSGLFTRGFEIVHTTGDHLTMLTEANAVSLARQMNLILDRYEATQNVQGDEPEDNRASRVADGRRRFGPAPAYPESTVA